MVAVPFRSDPPDVELPPGRWRNVLARLDALYPGAPAVYERTDP